MHCIPDSVHAVPTPRSRLRAGRRRLLRLLGRLRATEVPRHGQLLTAATARDPALAAAFLAALPWMLDPRPSTQWLAAATLTGQVRQMH